MGQPIIHVEIMGKNAVGLQKFYADLFNWKIAEPIAELGMYAMIDGASSGVAGGIGQDPDGKIRTTVYVEVPDLQAALDKAVRLGGKVVMPPMDIPDAVSMAQFSDPDGNVIGLVKG